VNTIIRLAFALALFSASIGPVQAADQISGRELLESCNGSNGENGKHYCDGYILAAVETHATWALWGRLERVICFPKGDKFDHAFGAVMAYLDSHPNELDFEASSIVLNALNRAFPCE
tara:strand:+ start:772 stop:1125 length:354 start_codon:yes stop_codon:yes gene_type:complete